MPRAMPWPPASPVALTMAAWPATSGERRERRTATARVLEGMMLALVGLLLYVDGGYIKLIRKAADCVPSNGNGGQKDN